MKDAIGGSLLLSLVAFILSTVVLFFVGIISYSKAYKIKNRIVEVIERNETYNEVVVLEINDDLRRSGYIVSSNQNVSDICGSGNLNNTEYLYCVYEDNHNSGRVYEIVTYIRFQFPIIDSILTFPVKGETKVLGKDYSSYD